MDELLLYLEDNEMPTSQRTLERDFQLLRNDFKIAISFDRHENGYYIDEESSLDSATLYGFLEIANTAELFNPKNKAQQSYIQFQKHNLQKNTHFLSPILEAINAKLKVELTYQTFYGDEARVHLIDPYLVKQYDQRWYVYGWSDAANECKTFALDRTLKLRKTNTSFKKQKKDASEVFSQVVGVSILPQPVERVLLQFTRSQAKYISTLPLHHSQQEVTRSADYVTFEYWVIPNFELEQKILMQGPDVEVLEPKILREKIKKRLVEAAKIYDRN